MSEADKQAENDYGRLMACLTSERNRYATESEFRAFAVESVRRFISDLRAIDIELTMRPKYLEKPSSQDNAKE